MVDLLRRAGIEVVMVSISGSLQVTGSHKISVLADILFEEADFNDGECWFFPEGCPVQII